MAGMSGVAGNITFADAIGGAIKTWSANFTRTLVPIISFGSVVTNREAGVIDATGSMSGVLDTALSPTLAFSGNTAAATITLTAQTGNTLQFKVLVDAFSCGVTANGESTFSANFALASTAATFADACTATWS